MPRAELRALIAIARAVLTIPAVGLASTNQQCGRTKRLAQHNRRFFPNVLGDVWHSKLVWTLTMELAIHIILGRCGVLVVRSTFATLGRNLRNGFTATDKFTTVARL